METMNLTDLRELRARYLWLSLEELVTPREGDRVMLDLWWAMDDRGLFPIYIFGGAFSPQANRNRIITERFGPTSVPNFARVRLVSVSYLPHDCHRILR